LAIGGDRSAGFASVIPQLLESAPDCGGLIALPFMDDEPGLGVGRGGTATIIGLTAENATPGNAVKSALLATMFNLRLGSEVLDAQGFPRTELVLSGGLTKTPELGQILADVFGTPVTLLESAEEGTAWGAALMAKFRHAKMGGLTNDWAEFLEQHARENQTRFEPEASSVAVYEAVYQKYKKLIEIHGTLDEAVH
jgi:sugar (pentulose or hexulose) kinase